jgi:hypothetical protein
MWSVYCQGRSKPWKTGRGGGGGAQSNYAKKIIFYSIDITIFWEKLGGRVPPAPVGVTALIVHLSEFHYDLETHSTDLQHVHNTTWRNFELASHCFLVSRPITSLSYGYRKIRYGYSTATNWCIFPHSYEIRSWKFSYFEPDSSLSSCTVCQFLWKPWFVAAVSSCFSCCYQASTFY